LLKKSITYTDLNGDEVTESFFFHLSKADLVEMEVTFKGGLVKHLEEIVKSEDGAAIIQQFKDIILRSYGIKSDDGKRFIKSKMMTDDFLNSEAYSTLFLELCTDAGAAADFVNGIIPTGLSDDVTKLTATTIDPTPHPSDSAATPAEPNLGTGRNVFEQGTPEEPRELTRAELTEMDDAELRSGLAEGRYRLA
jgi:hypothetical protein